MKIAYFDCFSGISGDMAVGALVHAGATIEYVREGLRSLEGLPSTLRYETRPIVRSAVHALKFDVMDEEGKPVDRVIPDHRIVSGEEAHHHAHDHSHEHSHHHSHGHSHHHDDGHYHDHHTHHHEGHSHDHHDHHHHTSFSAISAMIDNSSLPERVKERSIAIFKAIAVGEARVHNMDVENVHFHEVGAYDSIADIVAVALCLEELNIDQVYASAIPLGSGGMIRTQHGTMPLPAPATIEILQDYPVMLTSLPYELTTPTGAGIIRALSEGDLQGKNFHPVRTGFGAGTRELPDRPNLLRVMLGQLDREEERDSVILIETNIDDMTPEAWPLVMERILDHGGLDIWLTPVLMKKGRPGYLLSALAEEGNVQSVTEIIFAETTTIGIRTSRVERQKLIREEVVVETEFGPVRMKRIEGPGGSVLRPEADEVRRISEKQSLPFMKVQEILSSERYQTPK